MIIKIFAKSDILPLQGIRRGPLSESDSSSFSVRAVVLVQPRKTRPCLTERLLMGRKETNQKN